MKIKKTLLYSLLFLIAALQCLFLGSIIYEQHLQLSVFVFTVLLVFLLVSYFHTYIKEYHIQYDSWKGAIWIFIGASSVWFLRNKLGLDAVLATAIIGVMAGLLPVVLKRNKYFSQVPAAVYCGAFIAMTNIQKEFSFILIASGFAFFAFVLAKSIMNGIGGKLGTLAFVGVVLAYSMLYLIELI